MLRQAIPQKTICKPPKGMQGKPYFRMTLKMLYLSKECMALLPDGTESISILVDYAKRRMFIRPGDDFKLHPVCETQGARRIETSRVTSSLLQAGFPVGLLDHHLMCEKTLDGAVCVSLIPYFVAVQ